MRIVTFLIALGLLPITPIRAEFQVGAAVTDVTPKELPVLVNGSMVSRSVDKVKTPVSARAVAMSDGVNKIVIVTVDSCMMPRDLLDNSKKLASEKSGIPMENILISATHTHSAPSCMGVLGTDADPAYVIFLTKKLVDAVLAPLKNLEPAKVGYGKVDAGDYTALRRWVMRPDRTREDPFGNFTGRANMHAGNNWDDVTGETGPEDPDLGLISFQALDGRPIAVFGNFSMHYFGDQSISADYFGLFSEGLKERIQPETPEGKPDFVGLMSHGCSGDIWRRDYTQDPEKRNDKLTIDEYSNELLNLAMNAYESIEYSVPESIAMAETRMNLNYRVPDAQRLEWAKARMAALGDNPLKDKSDIYAKEQIILHERQNTEIVVQGLRIGDLIGITTTPNETYAITGLKVKAASPLPHNMVIELANGGDGYIPPPEQHLIGGYNTWAARSAGLEVQAEPKIVEASIQLLEEVTGKSRVDNRPKAGPAVQTVLDLNPKAYWRLDEFAGPRAIDSSPNHFDAIYEPQVLFYLEGPNSGDFAAIGKNRAAHFAGHRMQSRIPELGEDYTVSLWFWNGMPNSGREVTGWIFSRDHGNGLGDFGDHVGIGGVTNHSGNLIYMRGDGQFHKASVDAIERWTWNHLAFVREMSSVAVYLNGKIQITLSKADDPGPKMETFFFGGRSDNKNNFEGRLDEIAIFDRAVPAKQIKKLAGK